MLYGSKRFATAVSNNTNLLELNEGATVSQKIVVGKDVALLLPDDPAKIGGWEAYPTHQASWLPLWFIALYHAKAESDVEQHYQEQLQEIITDDQRSLLRRSLVKRAQGFLDEYRASQDETRKRNKRLTRIVQDILLYLDMPKEVVIDQDDFRDQSVWAELVRQANELRESDDAELAQRVEAELQAALEREVIAAGGQETIDEAAAEVDGLLTQNGEIYRVKEPRRDLEFYTDLLRRSTDLELAADEHDRDAIAIRETVEQPEFHQIEDITHSRRLDLMVVPSDLALYDTVRGGHESFQPVSYMVLTHSRSETPAGQTLQDRLQHETTPQEVAEHYLGAAADFLDGEGYGKSWARRREAEVPMIKKTIPLHRVGRDLLPRAIWMLEKGTFPIGVSDDELWQETEMQAIAQRIDRLFETQAEGAELSELDQIAEDLRGRLQSYDLEHAAEIYREHLLEMSGETTTEISQETEPRRLS